MPATAPQAKHHRLATWLSFASLLSIATVAILSLSMGQQGRDALYSTENSMIERVSVVLWIGLALALPIIFRRMNVSIIAGMIVCAAAAAREADLHKSYSGYSVLKIKYYLADKYPVSDRMIAGLIVGIAGIAIAWTGFNILRHAGAQGWVRARWVRIILLIFLAAGLSKSLDRSPEMLEDVNVQLAVEARYVMKAVEESLELLLPVLAFIAAISFARAQKSKDVNGMLRAPGLAADAWPSTYESAAHSVGARVGAGEQFDPSHRGSSS